MNPSSATPAFGAGFVRWFYEIGIQDIPWVAEGIDSISLNPDSVLKTTAAILEEEQSPLPQ